MLQLEEALERILSALPLLPSETVPIQAAAGRILMEDVAAVIDLPAFANSGMDGYAVRVDDVSSASSHSPVDLRLIGQVAAGGVFSGSVSPGTCVRVFTGSPVPAGAEAIVMQEDTQPGTADGGLVQFLDSAQLGENIRLRGTDARCGDRLLRAGKRLTAARLSLLASAGVATVRSTHQPVVGLLSTGSELRTAGESLQPGQIYESNRLGLAALLPAAGASPRVYPLVPDCLPETRAALAQAFEECDAVLTTGGVSVGEMDFVKTAFTELGGELMFWKVAVKPGKPFVFGRWEDKLLFGLPGNPVSALVTFLLLVRPALLHWQGGTEIQLPLHPGVLCDPLVNSGDRRHFMSVKVKCHGQVRLAGTQGSHLLRALAAADGLVDVPPQTTWPAGTTVQVLRWEV